MPNYEIIGISIGAVLIIIIALFSLQYYLDRHLNLLVRQFTLQIQYYIDIIDKRVVLTHISTETAPGGNAWLRQYYSQGNLGGMQSITDFFARQSTMGRIVSQLSGILSGTASRSQRGVQRWVADGALVQADRLGRRFCRLLPPIQRKHLLPLLCSGGSALLTATPRFITPFHTRQQVSVENQRDRRIIIFNRDNDSDLMSILECSIQTDRPLSMVDDDEGGNGGAFAVVIQEMQAETDCLAIGIGCQPYPCFQLPGKHSQYSVAYLSTGTLFKCTNNENFAVTSGLPKYSTGDKISIHVVGDQLIVKKNEQLVISLPVEDIETFAMYPTIGYRGCDRVQLQTAKLVRD